MMVRMVRALCLVLLLASCSREAAPPAPERQPRPVPPSLPIEVEIPADPGEAGVRDFVTIFMDMRLTGDDERARDFLSPTALEQYGKPELPLTSMSFTGWDLVSLNAADANSWEARVRIRREDDQFGELLFVGPGADAEGTQRPWIIRGASPS